MGLKSPAGLPSARKVAKIARAVYGEEKMKPKGELNVIFVDGRTIRRLNKAFLNESGDTDVIAFPYDPVPGRSDVALGDIYISVPEARRNAFQFRQPLDRELVRLIVHGVLHLLGYTDHSSKEKAIMWSKQEKLVDHFSPL